MTTEKENTAAGKCKVNREEFEKAVKPVMKYLCENHHPHHTIVITPTRAELSEGQISSCTDEYVLD